MAVETRELAPLGVLIVVGILAIGGWILVLGEDPAPEGPAPRIALRPAAIPGGPTPLDEAIEAVARAGSQGVIRCAVPDSPAVDWPFEVAHHEAGLLRAVVPAAEGSRLYWPASDEPTEPIGTLRWSGAAVGQVGGCETGPTSRSRVEGTVTVDGQPASDVRVRVCGTPARTDAEGRFSVEAWSSQHCLAWVSQHDLTHDFAPVVVPMEGPATVSLTAKRGADGPADPAPPTRRVLVRRSLSERALSVADVSDDARSLLEEWAGDDRAAKRERAAIAEQADAALSDEPGPP
jgi:hypothetical protein